ncbi:MAG: multiheme c-type cytochrome, partial [Pseudomonadota bacterium]
MRRQGFTGAVIFFFILTCCNFLFAGEADQSKFPFFPSLITTDTGKPVTPDKFEDPSICAGCHPDIHAQWKGSMHSFAFADPVFTALWKLGAQETKGATTNLCGGCHTAIGVVSRDLTLKDGDFHTSEIARQGVQCDLCHTIKATAFLETPTYEPQNASFVVDPGKVKRGPYKDATSPQHETAYSELHTKSEFCANCHQVFHPFNNFHIERTYDEWKYSVYAQNNIQCQDCHMMPIEKAVEAAKTLKRPQNPGQPCIMGPKRDNMFTHEFVGANFTVPALLGDKKHAELAERRLKSAAELEISSPQSFTSGANASIAVKVTNVAAGHNLPTSLTEVRQMWLDIKVTDAAGKELFRSGALDAQGNLSEDAKIFNAHAVDKNGQYTVKPWEMVRFESNKTIPPKGSATEKFIFLIPQNTK